MNVGGLFSSLIAGPVPTQAGQGPSQSESGFLAVLSKLVGEGDSFGYGLIKKMDGSGISELLSQLEFIVSRLALEGEGGLPVEAGEETFELAKELKKILDELEALDEVGLLVQVPLEDLVQLKDALTELVRKVEESGFGVEHEVRGKRDVLDFALMRANGGEIGGEKKRVEMKQGLGVVGEVDEGNGEEGKGIKRDSVIFSSLSDLVKEGVKERGGEKEYRGDTLRLDGDVEMERPMEMDIEKIKNIINKIKASLKGKDRTDISIHQDGNKIRMGESLVEEAVAGVKFKHATRNEEKLGLNEILSSQGGIADRTLESEDGQKVVLLRQGSVDSLSGIKIDAHSEGISAVGKGLLTKDVATEISSARVVMAVKHLISMNKIPGGMRIRLHPPELGTLRIDVKMDQGDLLVQLQAEKESAHQLIKSHLGEIKGHLLEIGQFQDVRVELLPSQDSSGARSENYLNWQGGGQRRQYEEQDKAKDRREGFSEVFSEVIDAIA